MRMGSEEEGGGRGQRACEVQPQREQLRLLLGRRAEKLKYRDLFVSVKHTCAGTSCLSHVLDVSLKHMCLVCLEAHVPHVFLKHMHSDTHAHHVSLGAIHAPHVSLGAIHEEGHCDSRWPHHECHFVCTRLFPQDCCNNHLQTATHAAQGPCGPISVPCQTCAPTLQHLLHPGRWAKVQGRTVTRVRTPSAPTHESEPRDSPLQCALQVSGVPCQAG